MSGIKNIFAGGTIAIPTFPLAGEAIPGLYAPVSKYSFWNLSNVTLIIFAPILMIGLIFYGIYFYGVIKKKKNKKLFKIGSQIILIDIAAYIIYRLFEYYSHWYFTYKNPY